MKQQRGFTMVELLMGLGVGIFLLGSGIYLYSVLMSSFYSLLASNRLELQMTSAMNSMVTNIRRAGYYASAVGNIAQGSNTNPFMASAVDLQTPSSSCILFAYDADVNSALPATNSTTSDERFGYRLSGTVVQGRPLTDSAFSCSSGVWENLTDPNLIQITNLTFTISPTVVTLNAIGNTLVIRNVTISITGRLANDATVTRTMTETVRVRNDKFQT